VCSNGVPSFAKVADSPEFNGAILGVGHGTVTSLNGQAGTGLVWTSDVQGQNLRVYNAIPKNGNLTLIKSFSVPGTVKFTRPVFGDGIVYQGTNQGYVYGFGAPTNPPFTCTAPAAYGSVDVGQITTATTVTCTSKIALKVTNVTASSADYVLSSIPNLPATIATGSTFTFKVAFQPTKVGSITGSIVLGTTNNVGGYSIKTSVRLTGTGSSTGPLLSLYADTVSFGEVVTGSGAVTQTALLSNDGNSALTISNIQFSNTGSTGPFIDPTTSGDGKQVGAFTFTGLPSTIAETSQANVIVSFNPTTSASSKVYVVITSNGGSQTLLVTGSSGAAPVALLQFQTSDGTSWVTYQDGKNFTFGNVTENQTRSLKMRLTNNGDAGSIPLSITVSKPPFGVTGIIGAANQVDLGEGMTLNAGESATATLYCSPPKTQWDTDSYNGYAQWTMNTNDPVFGKHFIQFVCQGVAEQAAPLLSNGQGRYRYAGCYKENNPGRQLAFQLYGNDNNTIAMCVAACAAKGYLYCGTQYNRECWGGPTIPKQQVSEDNCNYPCKGDINQVCGGNGVGAGAGGAYISLFMDSARGQPLPPSDPSTTAGGDRPVPTITGPVVNPGLAGYRSNGCYQEGSPGRALPNLVSTKNRTVAACIAVCGDKYAYLGLEYGGEVSMS
jgi:hypothetical protein